MDKIIKMIENKYLIGSEQVARLDNGNILFTQDDGSVYEQTKREFINDYIDLLTDLLNQNREDNYISHCIYLCEDLKMLYEGLGFTNFNL